MSNVQSLVQLRAVLRGQTISTSHSKCVQIQSKYLQMYNVF